MTLKPCPFCGDPPRQECRMTRKLKTPVRYWSIKCICGAQMHSDKKEKVIKAWNTRAGVAP